jgi:hypothetical protein
MTRASLILFAALFLGSPAHADEKAGKKKGLPHAWPPKIGQLYPELKLKNYDGKTVSLRDYQGKVILVEPIGMGCPACQAFAGAGKKGGFQKARHQKGIKSAHEIMKEYAKVKLTDRRIVFVHLLLYDMSSRKAPTVADAKAWAKHWGLDKQKNALVLVADQRYINRASWNLVPGFQLIDKDFVLRSDSSGHHPKDNLYRKLLPMVKKLLKAKAKTKPKKKKPPVKKTESR